MRRPTPLLQLLSIVALLPASVPAIAQVSPDDVLTAQILLDRAHHSPGVIDGSMGGNTHRAIAAYERVAGLVVDGMLDEELLGRLRAGSAEPLLMDYTIKQADVAALVNVPDGMQAQASLDRAGFETAVEALAEKFHMGQGLLERLNPGADFKPGDTIRVVRPGSDVLPAKVSRIEVDKASSELRALDSSGRLVASYPATIGSASFPSPSGSMAVRAVAPNPTYYFDPANRSWGPDERLTIAAGPNNPVGSTWIDLTQEGYGIHGTPEPRLIGKTASHGCVRLTNWDAEELAKAVEQGTTVTFL